MVSSYTQLLARRYGDALDQDAHDFIGFAVDGASRMQRLIQDLLAYSRVTTRGRPLGDVDAGVALRDALANLQAGIDASAAVVTQEPLPHLPADAGQLTQLFQNLVANAIKFRRPGEAPRIHVGCRRVAGAWEVAVRDEGIGIPKAELKRVFHRFYRVEHEKVRSRKGTGLGLFVVSQLVRNLGGSIHAESEGVGRGSTFEVRLPVKPPR